MKKIIFITNNLNAGGAEKQIWFLSKYLKKNNKITVITLTDLNHKDFYKLDKNIERIQLQNNITKKNIFYNLIKLFLLIIELRNILKLHKPDTIISFLTFANLITILAGFNLGIKKIISERTDLNYFKIPIKYKILSFLIYRFADLLVVQSKIIKNYFINYNVNINVIYNIISNNRNLVKKNNFNFLNISRLSPEKNVQFILSVVKQLHILDRRINLSIIGDGPLKKNLKNYVKKNQLRKAVKFIGIKRNTTYYFRNTKFYINASFAEGMPNAVFEAMSHGLTCFIININNNFHELLKHNKNCFVLSNKNSDKIAFEIFNKIKKKKTIQIINKNSKKLINQLNILNIGKSWEKII